MDACIPYTTKPDQEILHLIAYSPSFFVRFEVSLHAEWHSPGLRRRSRRKPKDLRCLVEFFSPRTSIGAPNSKGGEVPRDISCQAFLGSDGLSAVEIGVHPSFFLALYQAYSE